MTSASRWMDNTDNLSEATPLLFHASNYRPDDASGISYKSGRSRDKAKKSPNENSEYDPIRAFLIFFFPAIGGLLYGFSIGGNAAILTQIQDEVYSGVGWSLIVKDSVLLQGTYMASDTIGALLGSLICWYYADALGRKRTLMLSAALFITGSMLEALGGFPSFNVYGGLGCLLFGSTVYGIACGFAMHGAPAYIGEMAPSCIRGFLVSMKECMIVVGMVLGYTFGWLVQNVVGGWTYLFLFSGLAGGAMFAGMYYLPYSARWLALKNRMTEAYASLRFVTPRIPEQDLQSFEEIAERNYVYKLQEKERLLAESNLTYCDKVMREIKIFTEPTVYPALIASMGLVFFQQITGQPSFLEYADELFKQIGVGISAAIVLASWKLVMTLLATLTVDVYGRKNLLYLGCGCMGVGLVVLSVLFIFPATESGTCNIEYTDKLTCGASSACQWSSECKGTCAQTGYQLNDCTCCGAISFTTRNTWILIAVFIYIGGYQVGFGPISWLLISEIFPLEVRGRGVSIAIVCNFFWNAVTIFLYPTEVEYMGKSITFSIYFIFLMISVLFVYKFVPETKGMTLEQIEEYFLEISNQERREQLLATREEYDSPEVHVPPVTAITGEEA